AVWASRGGTPGSSRSTDTDGSSPGRDRSRVAWGKDRRTLHTPRSATIRANAATAAKKPKSTRTSTCLRKTPMAELYDVARHIGEPGGVLLHFCHQPV